MLHNTAGAEDYITTRPGGAPQLMALMNINSGCIHYTK